MGLVFSGQLTVPFRARILKDPQSGKKEARQRESGLWSTPPLVEVCRYIAFEGLRDALTSAHDYISFLKPDWLQKISESCALED